MYDELWYTNIEPTILTRLQYYLTEKSEAPYPDLTCTTTKRNLTETETTVSGQFPTLYLFVQNAEVGNDLENIAICGINSTVEITVYDNVSKERCEQIASAAMSVMKSMKFNTSKLPLCTEYKNIYLANIICRRLYGAGDEI